MNLSPIVLCILMTCCFQLSTAQSDKSSFYDFCSKLGFPETTPQKARSIRNDKQYPWLTKLAKETCSPIGKQYFCAIYSPLLHVGGTPVQPCRSSCEAVTRSCAQEMKKFGGDKGNQILCFFFSVT